MDPLLSVETAEDYFVTKLHCQAWQDSSHETKEKALIEATRLLNTLSFKITLDDTAPQAVLDACCDIALALLDGIDPDKEQATLAQVSQGFSSVRSTYDRTFVQDYISAGIPSATAWNKIYPYLNDNRHVKLSRVS